MAVCIKPASKRTACQSDGVRRWVELYSFWKKRDSPCTRSVHRWLFWNRRGHGVRGAPASKLRSLCEKAGNELFDSPGDAVFAECLPDESTRPYEMRGFGQFH